MMWYEDLQIETKSKMKSPGNLKYKILFPLFKTTTIKHIVAFVILIDIKFDNIIRAGRQMQIYW